MALLIYKIEEMSLFRDRVAAENIQSFCLTAGDCKVCFHTNKSLLYYVEVSWFIVIRDKL